MPVINKTKAQFLVLPLPSWFPIAPWPIPFTAGHLQSALDEIEEFVLSNTAWDAIKTIFLTMDLSSFEKPEDMADVIEDYCEDNEIAAWAVEVPE